MSELTFVDVTIDYGTRRVVEGFNERVATGEWLALVGPNGAGKSSVLRAFSASASAALCALDKAENIGPVPFHWLSGVIPRSGRFGTRKLRAPNEYRVSIAVTTFATTGATSVAP